MQYSPKESRPSTLTEDFRTLIQRMRAEWLGNLPTEPSGDSLSTLGSGLTHLATLIDTTVSPTAISSTVLDSLEWGDGSVDLPEQVGRMVKQVILDVIEEFGQDRSHS